MQPKGVSLKIDIDTAVPGMILAQEVILPNGAIAAPADSTLTELLIEKLRKNGVRTVDARSPEQEKPQMPQDDTSSPPPHRPSGPDIQVIVAEDAMTVSLLVESAADRQDETLTPDAVSDALGRHGIVFGFDPSKMNAIAEDWNQNKTRKKYHDIAHGRPPKAGSTETLRPWVKHLSTREQLDFARETKYCRDLVQKGYQIQRVRPGDTVARVGANEPGSSGTNVLGEEIPIPATDTTQIHLDNTVTRAESGPDIKAKAHGIVYLVENKVGILPMDFSGAAEADISDDRMTGSIRIIPPIDGGDPPSSEDIRNLLAENKIRSGVDTEALDMLVQEVKNGRYPEEPVVIARGSLPIDGDDGYVELFFESGRTLKPKKNEDGSVDFKNVDLVQSVTAGTKLARLHPPTEGVPGCDIFGAELPAKIGIPQQLPGGENVAPSPDDENILVALVDGNIRCAKGTISVEEGFTIEGNVDYATGNIKYDKSVVVTGDVKSGFEIHCGGDLQVGGTIEDAVIHCGGSVLCKHGFVGQGKGFMEIGGDANIGFLKNQTIRSRGEVVIAREALNAGIFAKKSICVNGNPLSAAGGVLVAGESITVRTVGNASGIRTVLEIGLDFTILEKLEKVEARMSELSTGKEKLTRTFERLDKLRKIKKKLPPNDEALYVKLQTTLQEYGRQTEELENAANALRKELHRFDESFIHVQHTALPGTVIKMGDRQHIIRQEVVGPKNIRLVRQEIKIL